MLTNEFTKLQRISKWAKSPTQINSQIVSTYLKIEREKNSVTVSELESRCSLTSKVFKTNFNKLKSDSGHAHGKVFHVYGNKIHVFSEAREEINAHF